MRKLLVALVAMAVGVVLTAPAVEAKEKLTLKNPQKTRHSGDIVTFTGRALCPLVYIYSVPDRKSSRALRPQRKRVHDRTFTFQRVVQADARAGTHWVGVRCTGRNGRRIGRVKLKVGVLPYAGGPSLLPKVLVGTGLVGAGGIMLMAGRRGLPYRRRRRYGG